MNVKQLKSDIPCVFLCLKDENTPIVAKILACITVGYALSPIDLIPDFIPILGYLDDLILLPFLVYLTIHFIPEDIWNKNSEKSKDLWKEGKPKKWVYSLPIIFIWILLLWILIRKVILR